MYPKTLEQVVDGPHGIRMGAVFHKTFMKEVFALSLNQQYPVYKSKFVQAFVILSRIRAVNATMPDGRRVTLDDVCFRPMGHDYDCLIFSPTNYFQVLAVKSYAFVCYYIVVFKFLYQILAAK